ncbi:7-deoxyloganetin glucosyltransferase-like [Aegilops tauschii subsp. strangulata]|uniref:Glycosyltransferase n=1 Tax=Aegilops tauschii subsp. strangulata TaxID=200361 RepID=A0A453JCI2_AEGTS|nr:7-deoxyloganetin glucosyltransferase-like [Aegilops tauschii subsp. strangulata]
MEVKKPHAVIVPLPTQGHVTPMLKLAKLLHCKGFHITFVNTEYNHRRLVRSRGPAAVEGLPDFRFATIPDGLPPSDADATQDIPSVCYSTMTTCLPPLKRLLGELNRGGPPVTCVVADNVMSFSVDAAAEIGVPCVLFWTASACGYMGYRNFRFLMKEGIAPLKDEAQLSNGYLDTPVAQAPGMSRHMRLRDFPSFICTTDRDDVMLNFLLHHSEQAGRAAAVIVNTLDELEQPALDAMRAMLPRVYTIGPLNLLADKGEAGPLAGIRASLWREDRSCLEWLDGREPRSVVYVNFGSITTMSGEELVEFAWGLANCGHPFLWIVRNDLLAKGAAVRLPPEFLEATKGRCLLASWCEQEAVLRHQAVGVFLTHSGWNSALVSISAGVPMLCWPFFAEQQTNARYACVEWGVGMEIGDDVRRDEVEARIREVMGGEGAAGREMKRRAAEWEEMCVRATAQPGGRSVANLESLIKDVLLAAWATN